MVQLDIGEWPNHEEMKSRIFTVWDLLRKNVCLNFFYRWLLHTVCLKKPVGLPLQVISRNLVNSQNLLIIFSTDRLYSILN